MATGRWARRARRHPHLDGLARPEVFNWPFYLEAVLTADMPNAVC